LYLVRIRYGDVPVYDGTIDRGTIDAVSSHPNEAGVFDCVSAALKCNSHPR
jgi:hypothetical protein